MNYAYFISPHGFGHAARACAVMEAVHARQPASHFEIFTQVPQWFFSASLSAAFTYHDLLSDIGLTQLSPLAEDLPATLERLKAFLPFDPILVARLAEQVLRLNCAVVVCDIAPLGIAVAHAAHLPSILIENFTWDWIYEGYADEAPAFRPHIEYLREVFGHATQHVRAEPAGGEHPATLTVPPISRRPRTPPATIRQQLAIPEQAKIIFLTMGGIQGEFPFLEKLAAQDNIYFVIPGGSETYENRGALRLVPHHSTFFHPDLLHAADVVIGKLGYSTLAETYHAGLPYGYLTRPRFRESNALAVYVQQHFAHAEISHTEYDTGQWLTHLPSLLAQPRKIRIGANGAEAVAKFVSDQ